MNRERLTILLDVMRDVERADKAFDMSNWATGDAECGFAACAAGYAALDGRLQTQGLRLTGLTDDKGRVSIATVAQFLAVDFCAIEPRFGNDYGYIALGEFFGLMGENTRYLFDPSRYDNDEEAITPAMVIARIEELLA